MIGRSSKSIKRSLLHKVARAYPRFRLVPLAWRLQSYRTHVMPGTLAGAKRPAGARDDTPDAPKKAKTSKTSSHVGLDVTTAAMDSARVRKERVMIVSDGNGKMDGPVILWMSRD